MTLLINVTRLFDGPDVGISEQCIWLNGDVKGNVMLYYSCQ